ncbi:MAG: DUF2851 family protein [Tannerella sp.]|jgi:hypothetical protein|nr:DUF2851 family protein [Tannerella sp.]
MEQLLLYIWKHKLYAESELTAADGSNVFVIDPGVANTDAGPDFFNAKVRINNTVWVGNVEIHERSSDWYEHHHEKDKAYDNVILHVVRHNDKQVYNSGNEPVMQAVMKVSQKIEDNIDWLLSRDTPVACSSMIYNVKPLYLSDWISALTTERLSRKTSEIISRYEQFSKDWNETFYITLMRNFGFGANGDAFEMLAKSLPFKFILKHRDNALQIEALLFGQAGLTEAEDRNTSDPYLQSLRREYDFLRKKYDLQPVEGYLFKKLRVRPVNFPHVRLAQLATLLINNDTLFSKILETDDLNDLRTFFDVKPSRYWSTHYNFGSASPERSKSLGKGTANIILINTVIPILFAYGMYKQQPDYCERALLFLENLPPESNSIVKIFGNAGITANNAGDTQALIQLRREYCDRKKCLYCRIGFRVIDNLQLIPTFVP